MAKAPRLWVLAAIAAICVALAGCATQPTLREIVDGLPAKHLAAYDFDPAVPIAERLGSIPDDLLALYSRADGVDYRRFEPDGDERSRLHQALSDLPRRHRDVLAGRLVAIYCIENFTGSGMADWILGPDDDVYAVLILHPRVFSMSASELITLRASSAFRADDPESVLEVELDEEVSALDYIVLHESTHIVDYAERHTPCVEPSMIELVGPSERETAFTDAAWTGYDETARRFDFPHRSRLRYYGLAGDPLVSNRELGAAYAHLARTPFVSLYASANWAEDFAEYVTFFYLTQARGYSYALRVRRAGEIVVELEPMRSPEVLDRARHLEPDLLAPAEDAATAVARGGPIGIR